MKKGLTLHYLTNTLIILSWCMVFVLSLIEIRLALLIPGGVSDIAAIGILINSLVLLLFIASIYLLYKIKRLSTSALYWYSALLFIIDLCTGPFAIIFIPITVAIIFSLWSHYKKVE